MSAEQVEPQDDGDGEFLNHFIRASDTGEVTYLPVAEHSSVTAMQAAVGGGDFEAVGVASNCFLYVAAYPTPEMTSNPTAMALLNFYGRTVNGVIRGPALIIGYDGGSVERGTPEEVSAWLTLTGLFL